MPTFYFELSANFSQRSDLSRTAQNQDSARRPSIVTKAPTNSFRDINYGGKSQAVKSKVNGLLQEPMENIFKAIGNWKVEKLVAGKKKSSKKYGALTEPSKVISYSKGDHYTYTVSFDLT